MTKNTKKPGIIYYYRFMLGFCVLYCLSAILYVFIFIFYVSNLTLLFILVLIYGCLALAPATLEWSDADLTTQEQPQSDQLWSVYNTNFSGLSVSTVHYVRPAVVSLWGDLLDFFDPDSKRTVLSISGPPGTGKSTTVFASAVYLGMRNFDRRNVLWIHISVIHAHLFKIVDGIASAATVRVKAGYDLTDHYKDCDVIFLDALHGEMKTHLFAAVESSQLCVTCTSHQSMSLSSESVCTRGYIPKEAIVCSWTLDEYDRCADLQIPAAAFANKEAVREWFFYAGGSIRLMFMDVDHLVGFLKSKVNQVSDKKLLLQGRQGFAGVLAVNTLIAEYDGGAQSVLRSQYVVRLLSYAGVDESFIQDAENRLIDNPAWQGWVYEMKVIHKINSCIKEKSPFTLTVKGKDNLVFNSCVKSMFFNVDDIPARVGSELTSGWFFPTKWNQGCFDVMFYSNTVLSFFQITKGDSHKYKLYILNPFLERLRHKSATVQFIVIAKKFDTFKVKNADLAKGKSKVWRDFKANDITVAKLEFHTSGMHA